MAVHPVGAGGFAAAAPTYARIRPTYAREVIGAIKQRVPAGSTVLDVGAGTGILAGQLRRARLQVVALEPSAEMLTQLVRTLPDVPSSRAVAEAVPMRDGSVGAVTVGEAFHWSDDADALAELRRVLCDGGVLAIARNRDEHDLGAVEQVMAGIVAPVAAMGGFGRPESSSAPNPSPSAPSRITELWTWTAT